MVKKTNANIPYSLDNFPRVLPQVKFFTTEPIQEEIRAFVGWDGIVIFDSELDIIQTLKIYAKQYQNYAQSCGRCLPGKYGGKVLYELLEKLQNHNYKSDKEVLQDIFKLQEVCELMRATSKCEVGKTTPNPILQILREKPEVFAAILPSAKGLDDCLHNDLDSLVSGLRNSAKRLQEAGDFVNRVSQSINSGIHDNGLMKDVMTKIESMKEEREREDLQENLIALARKIAKGEIRVCREGDCHATAYAVPRNDERETLSRNVSRNDRREVSPRNDNDLCHSDLDNTPCHSEGCKPKESKHYTQLPIKRTIHNDTESVFEDIERYKSAITTHIGTTTYISKITAPCTDECPSRVDIPAYIEGVKDMRYLDSLTSTRGSMPLAQVCGRVCPHPCENACRRAILDEPISIMELKRIGANAEIASKKSMKWSGYSHPIGYVKSKGMETQFDSQNLDCFVAHAPRNDGEEALPRNDRRETLSRNDGEEALPRNDRRETLSRNDGEEALPRNDRRGVSPRNDQRGEVDCHATAHAPRNDDSLYMESFGDKSPRNVDSPCHSDLERSEREESKNKDVSATPQHDKGACHSDLDNTPCHSEGCKPEESQGMKSQTNFPTQTDSTNKHANSSNCSMALNAFTEREGRSYLSDNDYPSFSVNHSECIDKDEFSTTKISSKSVGVIGAGPAGLSTAYYLGLRGIQVAVYEALPVLGGEVAVGVPNYRMPIVEYNHDIDALKELGVVFHTNYEVNATNILELEKKHDALVLAVGTRASKRLGCKNENVNLSGYLPAIKFMDSVNLAQKFNIGELPNLSGKRVVCVGGGFTSMDVVRCCVRLGASSVIMLYRRDEATIIKNTSAEEYHEAVEEGVVFQFLSAVDEIIEEDFKVKSLKINRYELIKSENSPKGELKLIDDGGMILECDILIPAVSQEMDFNLDSDFGVNITKWKTIEVDNASFATTKKGIFAAGDCVSGPLTIVNAVGQGRRVASVVSHYLNTGEVVINDDEKMEDLLKSIGVFDKNRDIKGFLSGNKREVSKKLNPEYRSKSFDEVNLGFDNEEAISEAQRCMRCYYISMCVVGKVAQGGVKEGLA